MNLPSSEAGVSTRSTFLGFEEFALLQNRRQDGVAPNRFQVRLSANAELGV